MHTMEHVASCTAGMDLSTCIYRSFKLISTTIMQCCDAMTLLPCYCSLNQDPCQSYNLTVKLKLHSDIGRKLRVKPIIKLHEAGALPHLS